jgi:hypothetical protein
MPTSLVGICRPLGSNLSFLGCVFGVPYICGTPVVFFPFCCEILCTLHSLVENKFGY